MNKFLRLIEQNRPGADTYTVELKDAGGLLDSFEMWGTGSPPEAFDAFRAELGNKIKTDQKLSKFLNLVDEYTPSEDKYTVELKDFKGQTIPNYVFGVQGATNFQEFIHDEFDKFKEEWGAPIPVEDQEIETGEDAVEVAGSKAKTGLAGAAAGAIGALTGMESTNRKAKKAVDRRLKVMKKILPAQIRNYNKSTDVLSTVS